jgi:septum formation protein
MKFTRLILGSRSPRRRELLELLIEPARIEVRPPSSSGELGFDGLRSWLEILQRLQQIARDKNDDVLAQLAPEQDTPLVLTADTVIVAEDHEARLHVLGQPPSNDSWREVVRDWFQRLYAGRGHIAATAVCLAALPSQQRIERVVQSHVWFRDDVEPLLDWYLSTDEPRGKAGGYALQGLASVFVTRLEGSLSNVVGLPLEALIEMLPLAGWPLDGQTSRLR